jgi:hypothetical protein
MVEKTMDMLPKRFFNLVLPGANKTFSRKVGKILELIGKTPQKILLCLRKETLNPYRFVRNSSGKYYFDDGEDAAFQSDHIRTTDNYWLTPSLTIESEKVTFQYLKPYLDFEAFYHLSDIWEEIDKLTCCLSRNEYSLVFRMLQKFFLKHYEEAERIRINIPRVKKYLIKILDKQGLKGEYENATAVDERGKQAYVAGKRDFGSGLDMAMINLHYNEAFIRVVRNALYLEE